jgi:hypothetical protein
MGNIFEQSLNEIWHGKKYSQMRDAHLNGKWNKYQPCSDCDTWMCRISETKREKLSNRIVIHRGPFFVTAEKDKTFLQKAKDRLKTIFYSI